MRVIYINPELQEVRESDITQVQALQLGVPSRSHWIVPKIFSGHDCAIEPNGLIDNLTIWFFHGCHIWGPMYIFRRLSSDKIAPPEISLERVREIVQF